MCPLCPGKRSGWRGLSRWGRFSWSDVNTLIPKELHQLPAMGATRPVTPHEGGGSKTRLRYFVKLRGLDEGMQHCTDAPRFLGGAAVPLTLFPQRTGSTMANASGIHHPQGPIPLRASFLRIERIADRTTQRAIRLGGEILAFHAALLPGFCESGRPLRSH